MRAFLCVSALFGAVLFDTPSPTDDTPVAPKAGARKPMHVYPLPEGQLAQSAHFSPDGSHVAILAILAEDFFAKGLAHVYEVKTDRLVRTITNPTRIVGLAFVDGGKKLVLSGWEDDFRVYGGDKWEQLDSFPNDPKEERGHRLYATPDGKGFLADNQGFAGPRLWDLGTKKVVRFPASESPSRSALSADGTIVARGYYGRIELYEAATAKLSATLKVDEGGFHSVRFSPDGKVLAAGYGHKNGTKALYLWDVPARKLLRTCGEFEDYPLLLVFTPDGKYVLTHTISERRRTGLVQVWEVATGRRAGELDVGVAGTQLALSPDGSILVTVSKDGRARKWDFAAIRQEFEARK